ncbi:hypothetical protein [Arcicella lustrica]|uniref:DUF4375 domain-containing protein n=1 Tax=Arcicella lustrica TaxID=2984196 RepID=A0ABU5SEY0_9BACT|nr:hypothetical protein [Arcicella sp. DC25W]MEA5425811.1 hypothetical protein [Arcicella sp. DC25W]
MERKIIEELIVARKLEEESDYDLYLEINDQIHVERKIYPLEVYLYGFDDSVLGDSFIFNYYEWIFFGLQEEPFNIKEKLFLETLVNNIDIFIPHANEWYCSIVNLLLYHYKESPYNFFIESLSKLPEEQCVKIGEILNSSEKEYFIYDDKGRVEQEYQRIVDFCFSK